MATPVRLPDGRLLEVHDAAPAGTAAASAADPAALTVIWHHGSPHTGALYEPLIGAAAARGIRLVTYARPSYGASTANPGRTIASAADDVARIADSLGIGRFAVMGASGGGSHALACAALLPGRVIAAATFACPAPYTEAIDWFAGMAAPGALRAGREGRATREPFAATHEFDPSQFIAPDWSALSGSWAALGRDAAAAESAGPDGLVDDDVALAGPWGLDLATIAVPVLLVQGGGERMIPRSHADLLLAAIPTAELWLRPREGHVSVLGAVPVAMDWLLAANV
jgi:pimeloyl-ACP methyl ester carboxylesterase